jgi:hypothetical protein
MEPKGIHTQNDNFVILEVEFVCSFLYWIWFLWKIRLEYSEYSDLIEHELYEQVRDTGSGEPLVILEPSLHDPQYCVWFQCYLENLYGCYM